jgi:hypothetical protein
MPCPPGRGEVTRRRWPARAGGLLADRARRTPTKPRTRLRTIRMLHRRRIVRRAGQRHRFLRRDVPTVVGQDERLHRGSRNLDRVLSPSRTHENGVIRQRNESAFAPVSAKRVKSSALCVVQRQTCRVDHADDDRAAFDARAIGVARTRAHEGRVVRMLCWRARPRARITRAERALAPGARLDRHVEVLPRVAATGCKESRDGTPALHP